MPNVIQTAEGPVMPRNTLTMTFSNGGEDDSVGAEAGKVGGEGGSDPANQESLCGKKRLRALGHEIQCLVAHWEGGADPAKSVKVGGEGRAHAAKQMEVDSAKPVEVGGEGGPVSAELARLRALGAVSAELARLRDGGAELAGPRDGLGGPVSVEAGGEDGAVCAEPVQVGALVAAKEIPGWSGDGSANKPLQRKPS